MLRKILYLAIMLAFASCNQQAKQEPESQEETLEDISSVQLEEVPQASSSNGGSGTQTYLIINAKIFDGSEKLVEGKDVLVIGNKIAKVSSNITAPEGTEIIDAQGATLSPGFIDSHAHIMFQMSIGEAASSDQLYFGYVATQTAKTYLNHGFTTIRDVAGNTFSLKKAIDKGIVQGPRIYPSGPMISQTSGHADMRVPSQNTISSGHGSCGHLPTNFERYGHVAVADGVPDVLKTVREVLHAGASQIKIAVGGGTGSHADPLDVTEYRKDEIQAAVDAAADWNTYVCAHVYNPEGARRAIDCGVKCIEHANLMDESTLRYMMEKDVWLSPQVIVYTYHPRGYTEDQKKKHDQAYDGIDNMFKICKKIGFKNIAFGSDIITDPEMMLQINKEFEFRTEWFTPAEVLQQATSKSAQLLALSGPRNPYPSKLGVIEEGAYADILLIDGNPLEKIDILLNPEENLLLIMKDGKVFKNILQK